MRVASFVLLAILLRPVWATGQEGDNRRCVETVDSEYLIQNNESVDPGSLYLSDSNAVLTSTEDWIEIRFSDSGDRIHIERSPSLIGVIISVCYRALPAGPIVVRNRSLEEYDSAASFKDYYMAQEARFSSPATSQRNQLFSTGGVETSGRLTRGLTIGNNNDLQVNSSLNLTLDGPLTDNLSITAVITDQTIPYQPEGNSARVQDLDRVYVKLYGNKTQIQAGDIVLSNHNSHFLRFQKNVQGFGLNHVSEESESFVGLSMAKGKVASVSIDPVDGLLGPYRIPGPMNEGVVIIANSEKVFLDGKLQGRGFNDDYTMDYNLGEITFMPGVMITKFSRIKVDFEYADFNFDQAVVVAGHAQNVGSTKLFAQVYSEKDMRNQPNFDLTINDRERLVNAGDSLSQVEIPGAKLVGFSPGKILYRREVAEGQEIYVYSSNPDSAVYEVHFSYVGPGNGDYQVSPNTVNGVVYEYLTPVDGVSYGDHDILNSIPAPKSLQIFTLGSQSDISAYETITVEGSFSSRDKNLYSGFDDEDNQGHAVSLIIETKGRKIGDLEYGWLAGSGLEFVSSTFSPLNRFRSAEFERDWSNQYLSNSSVGHDLILKTFVGISKDLNNRIIYALNYREIGRSLDGIQQEITLNKEVGKLSVRSDFFHLTRRKTKMNNERSAWHRGAMDIFYDLGDLVTGYKFKLEHGQMNEKDSLNTNANFFDEHTVYVRSPRHQTASSYHLSYSIREDRLPWKGQLVDASRSRNLVAGMDQKLGNGHTIGMTMTIRSLENRNADVDFGESESLAGRIQWQGDILDGILQNDLSYSANNSRAMKNRLIFFQVPVGEGNYHWLDQNEDGVQDLDEFYLANNLDERNYVKIFLPTNGYLDAFENSLNYRLKLKFPTIWKGHRGLKGLLYRISNTTSISSRSQSSADKWSDKLVPFFGRMDPGSILNLRESLRTTWYFNRSHTKYGVNFSVQQSTFVNLLSGGREENRASGIDVVLRYNLSTQHGFNVRMGTADEQSYSEVLKNRDFLIRREFVEPELVWQPSSTLRMTLEYSFAVSQADSDLEDKGTSNAHKVGGEIRWNKLKNTYLSTGLVLSEIQFTGNQNSPAGLAILQGLRPGSNINWTLNLQQTLIEGLQMSVSYQGRKSEVSRLIHIGRMSVSALF